MLKYQRFGAFSIFLIMQLCASLSLIVGQHMGHFWDNKNKSAWPRLYVSNHKNTPLKIVQ